MWGINNKKCVRMIPTGDDKWCVYWRPSLLLKTEIETKTETENE
jgi:hypothetical protein